MKRWIRPLKALGACEDALTWCEAYDSLDEAWQKCQRGDWMLWYAGKLSGKSASASRKMLVLAACACARLTLPFVTQGAIHPLKAIETAEAWAKGTGSVTLTDVQRTTSDAAYPNYAADAAYAANANYAAYYAADAANAAAGYAAYAAYKANAAYPNYANAAANAERTDTLLQCADIVRKFYPMPPTKGSR